MPHSNIMVIILSILIISCSQNKPDKVNHNDSIHISLPIQLPKDDIKKIYVVKKGDTLHSLGLHLKVDYKKIATWNDIKPPYKIKEGQKLNLYKLATASENEQTLKEQKSSTTGKVVLFDSANLAQPNKQKFIGHDSLQRDLMIAEVLQANPKLEIARAVWKASTAKIKQQGALQDPVLAYGLAPFTVDNGSTDYVQQIQLSQSIPWPGKLSLQSDAAMLGANRDEEKINILRLELTALAKKLYGDWFFIHQAHLIHHENVQLLSHVNKIAKIRYRIGKASQQEVLQSELELSLIEQHIIILNQQKKEILGHINTLLSRPADKPIPIAKSLPKPFAMASLQHLLKNGVEKHPKIKALSADIKSLELKKERAVLEALPNFNVKAGYSTQMVNSDKHFTVGFAMNLPLNLSKYQAIEDEASANLKRAQWKKQDQVEELEELIQLYFSKVKKYQNILVLYKEKILPLAKLNKQAALANYQASNGGFLELVKAENDWHSAQLNEKQALVDYHESLALFEYAIGVNEFSVENDL
ncbi:MAG: TolC family protein [Methylococcaceae bacterium]|nr:TolC family protein [Methylococcaceae bacterium]